MNVMWAAKRNMCSFMGELKKEAEKRDPELTFLGKVVLYTALGKINGEYVDVKKGGQFATISDGKKAFHLEEIPATLEAEDDVILLKNVRINTGAAVFEESHIFVFFTDVIAVSFEFG